MWRRGGGSSGVRGTAVIAVALVLGGCSPWLQIGYGPEHQRHNMAEDDLTLANVASLTERWSVEVPGVEQEAVVADGRVYVATGPGVRALDEDDGTTVWDRELWAGSEKTPVARSGDLLSYSGWDRFGTSICEDFSGSLDPADGSGVGPVTDRVSSPAVTAGSRVVQTSVSIVSPGTSQCNRTPPVVLEVRDVETGETQWRASIASQTSWSVPSPWVIHPTVAHGRVYLSHEGVTYAFALGGCGASTCSPIWSVTTGAAPRTPVAGPAGQVFVSSFTNLIALAGDDGSELWRADVYGELALAGDTIFATTYNELLAFDADGCGASTCGPRWTAELTNQPWFGATAPAIAGGVVYVGVNDAIKAYPAAGCGAPTCSSIVSLPLAVSAAGGAAAVTVANGKLFATSADTIDTNQNRITVFSPAGDP